MAALLLSRIVSLVVAAWLYLPRFGRLRLRIEPGSWRELFKLSCPFAINDVVSIFQGSLGVLILSFFAGNAMVGLFEAAVSLTLRMNVLGRAINDALYPFLSTQFMKNIQLLRQYTAKGIHYLIILGFLVATMLWVFGQELVLFLYGEEFIGSVLPLKLLALLIPVRFVTNSLSVALTASNRQQQRTLAVTVTAITNVALNLLLIPSYQLMGAVLATLITEAVQCGLIMWFLRAEAHEMIDWRSLLAPGAGALIILWSSFLSAIINIWVLMPLSVLLYSLTIIGLDRSSVKSLRLIATKR
jgi:O-antigen/teichoic acid export membrane protein